jgi:hypothetical protein
VRFAARSLWKLAGFADRHPDARARHWRQRHLQRRQRGGAASSRIRTLTGRRGVGQPDAPSKDIVVSALEYTEFRDRNRVFERMAA